MNKHILTSLFLAFAVLLTSSCSGGSSTTDKVEQPPSQKNQPPSISGTVPATVMVNQNYSFTPSASDPEGDKLTFSIVNQPVWAQFDTNTGNISGMPSSQDVGTVVNITISVSDGQSTVSLAPFDVTVQDVPPNQPPNQPPTATNQSLATSVNTDLTITLGPLQDADGDTLTYTVSNSTNTRPGQSSNQVIFTSQVEGTFNFSVAISDGINAPVNANITVIVSGVVTSKYITGREIIPPTLGSTPPAKGETRIDPITGTKMTRLTDASELPGTTSALIVYSRYTPENSDGKYFLAFGDNSTSSWVIERATGKVITKLRYDANNQIGENHEVRWDISGNHPNRVYFRRGMRFSMIDDVTDQDNTRSLIKDFSSLIPAASELYNDVEGDSSNDSDHWAWMAAHYNGSNFIVDAFVHYQISTGTVNILKPSDLAGTALDHYSSGSTFPKPNMVEMSPLGTGIVLHYGRAWGTPSYGSRSADIGTWFDGPHLWPVDFDISKSSPVKISIDETHSGWSFDSNGNEYFISQNNRTDRLDAIKITGTGAGYDNRMEVGSHSDFGWSNSFHYGKMPQSKGGWIFFKTYADASSNNTDWAANQLIMIQMKPESNNPVIWRIGSNYNNYSGDYRDEAPGAVNLFGNRIYLSIDWGGMLNNNEIFVVELPDNWQDNL